MGALKVGVLGCGNIASEYLKQLHGRSSVEVLACADRHPERAEKAAREHGVPRHYGPAELMADKDIELVLNLTIPLSHLQTSLEALQKGKHVYSEKPLGTTLAEAQALLSAAKAAGLRLGCAPDTVLGPGIQTCRKLIDEGAIGKPLHAVAFMASHGPEDWHPNPAFLYKKGAGPLLDVGPYYLTALVNLLGPVSQVSGSAKITFPERVIGSQPLKGTKIQVEMPTTVAGTLEFEQGSFASLIVSFDIWHHHLPRLEIYGTEGSLSVPDPNTFGGPVLIRKAGDSLLQEVPLIYPADGVGRGLGVLELALALKQGRPHRASAEIAFHILEVMEALFESSNKGVHVPLKSHINRPEYLGSLQSISA